MTAKSILEEWLSQTDQTNLNGVVRVREISKDRINESYEKALKMYAEKLDEVNKEWDEYLKNNL